MTDLIAVTADAVNEAHRLARSSAENAVAFAIKCGQLLLKKKIELGRGNFDSWIETECEFGRATAYNYIKHSKSSNALDARAIRHLFPSGRSEPQHQREPVPLPENGQTTDDLAAFSGQRFGCIVADPPWQYSNQWRGARGES